MKKIGILLLLVLLNVTVYCADFNKVIDFTFSSEGSKLDKTSSHSRYGVSKDTIKRYNKKYKTKYTVMNLTKKQANTIARKLYWEAYHLDKIKDTKLAISIFDFIYNSNPTNAAKTIEKAAKSYGISGIKVDGCLTISELKKMNSGGKSLANKICDKRLTYMQTLKVWPKYKKGWTIRVKSIKNIK